MKYNVVPKTTKLRFPTVYLALTVDNRLDKRHKLIVLPKPCNFTSLVDLLRKRQIFETFWYL